MATATVENDSKWISIDEAGEILGLNGKRNSVFLLMNKGLFTLLRLPGVHPRLLRADVEALMEASIVPAPNPVRKEAKV